LMVCRGFLVYPCLQVNELFHIIYSVLAFWFVNSWMRLADQFMIGQARRYRTGHVMTIQDKIQTGYHKRHYL
jgi:hypothetical protein